MPEGAFTAARRHPGDILGYLEAHIEQGPVLEAEQLSVGAVSGIAAQLRFELRIEGEAGHAGTSAMHLRRDALAGAAELMVEIERLAREGEADEVATVGKIKAFPGAANVVPGEVTFLLDVRAGDKLRRDALSDKIMRAIQAICERRKLGLTVIKLQDLAASPCDPVLVGLMEDALEQAGHPRRTLVSGAGHDAMHWAEVVPTGMIFIPCRDGISHNPAEFAEMDDIVTGAAVLDKVLRKLSLEETKLV